MAIESIAQSQPGSLAEPNSSERPISWEAWYVLVLLLLINTTNYIDRSMISIVLEPVKAEFGLSDSQLGTLSGFAHAAAYALFGVPLGMLADRVNRTRLLAAILFAWSAMTALASQVTSYLGLLLTRAAVGGAESGGVPASLSLISDYFPPRRRGMVIGIFFAASPVGFAISFGVGGYLVAHYGWRLAFLAAGIPGVVLALVLWLTVRDPRAARSGAAVRAQQSPAPPLSVTIRTLIRHSPLCTAVAGMVVSAIIQNAFWAWIASFLVRVHSMPIQNVGFMLALTAGITGLAGGVLGGFLSDRISRGSSHRAGYFIAAIHLLILPAAMVTLLTDNQVLLFAAMAVWMLLLPMYVGPVYALCIGLTETRMRGTMLSFIQMFSNLIGGGLGALTIGALSDLFGTDQSLRYAMLSVAAFNVVAACLYGFAARNIPRNNPGPL
jgi:predicted MFS family arabinose efflux permease